jgi:hypothetical protein
MNLMSTYTLNHLIGSPVTNVSSYFSATPTKVFNARTYERNEEASFAGVFCLATPLIFTYFCIASNALYDAMNIYMNIMVTGGLIFRVIAFNWVGNIAREQNRSASGWQTISMIFPSITLITLGFTQQLAPQQKIQQVHETIVHDTVSTPAIILQGKMDNQDADDQLLRKAS